MNPIIDLGKKVTPYWAGSQESRVNNAQQVAGTTGLPAHASLWTKSGGAQDLGTIDNTIPNLNSFGVNLNNNGVVVGDSGKLPYRWLPGFGMTVLPTIYGGLYAQALAVNDANQVVGWSEAADSAHPDPGGSANRQFRYAVLWSPTGLVNDLGTLGGKDAVASDINSLGQVVGFSGTPLVAAPGGHPFLWDPQNGMQDLGTLGGSDGMAFGINDHGVVIGTANTPGNASYAAFIWTAATGMHDLGTLYGGAASALDINNHGVVVGTVRVTAADGSGTNVAFHYRNGKMYDLNSPLPQDSGWRLEVASGINDHGDIVGYGQFGGELHGFLLLNLITAHFQPHYVNPADAAKLTERRGPRIPKEALYDPFWWLKWNPAAKREVQERGRQK